MSRPLQIPRGVGLVGALLCSLVLAVEFGLGIHLRGLSLNLALGLSLLLVVAFAIVSYRPFGFLALLALPLAAYIATDMRWQLIVGCAVKGACP
ncbi:MAG TPA: hypothetical protein PLF78_12460 [Caulobacter sp.]|nr:hypothetical protein [Caulobacter sp.]